MSRGKPDVLVEREAEGVREVEVSRVDPLGELRVQRQRRASRGEADDGRGQALQVQGDAVGGDAAALSGGGTEQVTIGAGCLIGANAGVGFSLGDDCVVEAGLYVTAGSKVTLPDGEVVKARALSAAPGLLFRRNSVSGAID